MVSHIPYILDPQSTLELFIGDAIGAVDVVVVLHLIPEASEGIIGFVVIGIAA
jgi:hypothetical protein